MTDPERIAEIRERHRADHEAFAKEGGFPGWHSTRGEILSALESSQARVRELESQLTSLAAQCHREKWWFQEGENQRPAVARVMRKAFDTLHNIGDIAIRARSLTKEKSDEA